MVIRLHKNARYSPWDPDLEAPDSGSGRAPASPRPHRPDPGAQGLVWHMPRTLQKIRL